MDQCRAGRLGSGRHDAVNRNASAEAYSQKKIKRAWPRARFMKRLGAFSLFRVVFFFLVLIAHKFGLALE